MKGLSRLLGAEEDAVREAVAASHDGRECAGVGGEATQQRNGGARPNPLSALSEELNGGGGRRRLNTSC